MKIFVACLPGLEPLLAGERLAKLGIRSSQVAGGVEFEGRLKDVYRANFHLGLASSVRVRLGRLRARHFSELVKKGSRLPFAEWLPEGAAVRISARSKRSKLYHSKGIEERVLAAGGKTVAGVTVTDDPTAPEIHVRLLEDECTISVDTSGEPLHRRGYRKALAKAPLREDIARARVMVSEWDQRSPLVDPLMGSGTVVIEAALMALGRAPGSLRDFAFTRLQNHDEALFASIRDRARAAEANGLEFKLFGSDRDRGAVEASTGNAERAGVTEHVQFDCAPLSGAPGLSALTDFGTGAIVTNPPYGKRIGNPKKLLPLYQTLGKAHQLVPDGVRFAMVSSDRRLALASGMSLTTKVFLDHGGTKVRLMRARFE